MKFKKLSKKRITRKPRTLWPLHWRMWTRYIRQIFSWPPPPPAPHPGPRPGSSFTGMEAVRYAGRGRRERDVAGGGEEGWYLFRIIRGQTSPLVRGETASTSLGRAGLFGCNPAHSTVHTYIPESTACILDKYFFWPYPNIMVQFSRIWVSGFRVQRFLFSEAEFLEFTVRFGGFLFLLLWALSFLFGCSLYFCFCGSRSVWALYYVFLWVLSFPVQ